MSVPFIVLGSSRSQGDTRRLVDALFHDRPHELVDLNDYEIGYYTYDYRHREDDFLPLAERMVSRDPIIFATPVYWYSMSAVMKTFFDRMSDLLEIRKDLGRRLKGKTLFLISCSGADDVPEEFEMPFRETAHYLDMHYGGYLHGWWEGDILQSPGETAFMQKIQDVSKGNLAAAAPKADPEVDDWWSKLDDSWRKIFTDAMAEAEMEGPENLSLLKSLHAHHSPVRTLAPLKKLPRLESLSLNVEHASKLDSLSELYELRSLSLYHLGDQRLESLSRLTGLTQLRLYGAGDTPRMLQDQAVLAGLSEIRELTIHNLQHPDLRYFSNMQKLEKLSLTHLSATNWQALTELKKLHSLDLSYSDFSDVSLLSEMANLSVLNCDRSLIHDLSPLARLIRLRNINVSHTRINSLKPLTRLPELSYLSARQTAIKSLEPLRRSEHLRQLDLAHTAIDSLEPLVDLKRLRRMDLSGVKLTSDKLASRNLFAWLESFLRKDPHKRELRYFKRKHPACELIMKD